MIDNIRHLLVGITIAVWAFLKPIEGDLLSLIIVFFLNFFFGYLSGLIANREDFELKKALRCIAEATIFFVLCCAIYTIGNLKHQPEGALQCVSFVTYVVLWFYTLNILKTSKRCSSVTLRRGLSCRSYTTFCASSSLSAFPA